jgi:hypothetical protein
MKYMFFPYVLYLLIINYNAAVLVGNYLELLNKQNSNGKPYTSLACTAQLPTDGSSDCKKLTYVWKDSDTVDIDFMRLEGFVLTILAFGFLIFFVSLEVGQLKSAGLEYFADVWNAIDMSSAALNFTFSFMFMWTLVTGDTIASFATIHTFAAFASFFMWLKVFYWCRLFSNLAYYVKLI